MFSHDLDFSVCRTVLLKASDVALMVTVAGRALCVYAVKLELTAVKHCVLAVVVPVSEYNDGGYLKPLTSLNLRVSRTTRLLGA